MNRSEGAKKVGPPQKNSLDPLLPIILIVFVSIILTIKLQTFVIRENNNGTTLPVSQLEQGGALVPLKF